MMLELVNYIESIESSGDKVVDINNAKELQRTEMIVLTQLWMTALKPNLQESDMLAQCVKNYFDRGMVSKSIDISTAFSEQAKCAGGSITQLIFPPAFEILKADGVSHFSTLQLPSYKVIVLVDKDCIFSKISAIQMARMLEDVLVVID